MTYVKPSLFELGNAKALILGFEIMLFIEQETTQTCSPIPCLACQFPGGGEMGVQTIFGCMVF